MLTALFNAATPWVNPTIDYHALAPEMVLAAGLCVVLLADLFLDESRKWVLSSLAGFSLLAAVLPVLTLGPASGCRALTKRAGGGYDGGLGEVAITIF